LNSQRRILLLFFFFLTVHAGFSQQLSNIRSKTFFVSGDTMLIDTLSIVPESFFIRDLESEKLIEDSVFEMDYTNAILRWNEKPVTDSIKISYRVFPFSFSKIAFHKDSRLIEPDVQFNYNPFDYSPENSVESVFNYNGLDYSGSFVRGISFGNSQDVILNSSFNLQMAGEIGDGIEVLAALTDNNIPIQPDGNTQQLQEFDKVFIQISKDQHKLIMGDYELGRPKSYFMNFYKKLQGANYSTTVELDENSSWKSSNSVAVAKGKFARNSFVGMEGNQGPYKMRGANGETFIIILAGTERVYIDGLLLTRGTEFDYVIDYNLGEVSFMPARLITKDSRIVIEFEYSEKSYFRSMIHLSNEVKLNNQWEFRINAFSEQDGKNQPVQEELTSEEKLLLKTIGDSVHLAFLPGIDSIAFDPSRILYSLKDTTVNTIFYDSVFVYSTDSLLAHYTLSFAQVEKGNGDYLIAQSSANGRVYKWVAPVNGVRQGNYAPIQILITPKKQQLLTVAADFHFAKNAKISSEIALSNKDENTFSDFDSHDDDGFAVKTGIEKKFLVSKSKEKISLFANADYEYANSLFKPVERYRSLEFERDWNLVNEIKSADEHLAKAELIFTNSEVLRMQYRFTGYWRRNSYQGVQQFASTRFKNHGFDLQASGSYLQSQDTDIKSSFVRPKADFSKSFSFLNGIKIGVNGEQENNQLKSLGADTLQSKSFRYDLVGAYFKSADSTKNQFSFSFVRRTDYQPEQKIFKRKTIADTWTAKGRLGESTNQFGWQFSFRNLDFRNAGNDSTVSNYLGRLDYSFSALEGFFRSTILYEIGTGQEQKREYSYQRVTEGQGIYQWLDYNDNGIEEANEFETAAFQDSALYIRILIPTDEYVPVNITRFNYLLSVNPQSKWSGKQNVLKFFSKISAQSNLQIDRKQFNRGVADYFNPFALDVADTSLISVNSFIQNTVYFNRTNSVFGFEVSNSNNANKILLVNGFESKQLLENEMKIRWNISRSFNTTVRGAFGSRTNDSENFDNKDYSIANYEASPSFTLLFKTTLRLLINYEFSNKINDDSLHTSALRHKVEVELKYNVVNKSTLLFSMTYASVNYAGASNSPLEFAMLEGLKHGNNFIWNATYNRKLSQHVELSVVYDGRKTGENKMIHTGRAQITALF